MYVCMSLRVRCACLCDICLCVYSYMCLFLVTEHLPAEISPPKSVSAPLLQDSFIFLPAGFSVATISEVLAGPFPFRPSFSQRCSLFMCVTYPHPWLWTSPLPVLLKINVDISVMTAGLAIGRGFEYFQHTVCNFAIRRALMTGRWRLLPSLLNRMHSKWNSAPSHK